MSDRTTINVDKETHSEAGDVKDDYDETWPEVLAFYAEYRPQVDSLGEDTNAEPMQVVPVEEVVGRDVPQSNLEQDTDALRHQLERNYEAIKEATNAAEGAKRTVENLR